jgi:hypothetical protein
MPFRDSNSLSMEILSEVQTTMKWAMRAKSKDWWNSWGIIWEPIFIIGVGSNVTTNSLIQLVNVRAVGESQC